MGKAELGPQAGSKWGAMASAGTENTSIFTLPEKTGTHGLGFDPFKVHCPFTLFEHGRRLPSGEEGDMLEKGPSRTRRMQKTSGGPSAAGRNPAATSPQPAASGTGVWRSAQASWTRTTCTE